MSFAPLQEELRIQHQVRLSDSALDMLMHSAGGVAESDRQALTDELESVHQGVAREARVQIDLSGPLLKRLYVSCDGITIERVIVRPIPTVGILGGSSIRK